MITSSIADGASLGRGRCAVVIQPYDPDVPEVEFASILVNVVDGELQSTIRPRFVVARVLESEPDELLIMGRLGQVALLRNGALTEERIVGPEDLGFLTDARAIGTTVYAVGMRRQAYVRTALSSWLRADFGARDESNSVDQITGFRSVDGWSSEDVYAVGLDGEIWNFRAGVWRAIESPTNVILEQVRCGDRGNLYAAGQAGVLLRGSGDAWAPIDEVGGEDEFWGLEWFRGRLYAATGAQLFCLDPQSLQLEPVLTGGTSFARLRQGHGALWSFGPEEVRWTADGKSWHDVAIPKAHATTA